MGFALVPQEKLIPRTSLWLRACRNLVALGLAALAAACSEDSSDPRPPVPAIERLPFDAAVFDILADDFDNNGLLDLALTTHTGGFSQIFYQTQQRNFAAGPKIKEVGFHPGDLVALRTEEAGDRLYLMNAEGENALRVFRANENPGLEQVAAIGAPAPRIATQFSWPGRGLGLAFGPFARNSIFVITEFDPLKGARGPAYELPLPSSLSRVHHIAASDLDRDGSDEVLFIDATSGSLHKVSAPEADALPTIDTLWRFDDGGRRRLVLPADINQDGWVDLLVPEEVAPRERESAPRVVVFFGGHETSRTPTPIPLLLDDPEGGREAAHVVLGRGFNAMDFAVDNNGAGLLLLTTENEALLVGLPKGWSGEPLATRRIPFGARSGIRKALLVDLDGDGWLDAVIGLTTGRGSNLIMFGPLWKGAERMLDRGSSLEEL